MLKAEQRNDTLRRSSRHGTKIHVGFSTEQSPEATPREDAREKMLVDSLLERRRKVSSQTMEMEDASIAKKYNSTFMRNKQRDRINDYIKISRHIVQKVKSGQSLKSSIVHQQHKANSNVHRSTLAIAQACISSVDDAKQSTRFLEYNTSLYITTPNGGYLVVDNGELVLRSRHSKGKKRDLFTLRSDSLQQVETTSLSLTESVAFEVKQLKHQCVSSIDLGHKVSIRLVNWQTNLYPNQPVQDIHSHIYWYLVPVDGKLLCDGIAVCIVQYLHVKNSNNLTAHCLGHDLQLHVFQGKATESTTWKLKYPSPPLQPAKQKAKPKSHPIIYPLSRPQSRYKAWDATRAAALEQQEHDASVQNAFEQKMIDDFREYAINNPCDELLEVTNKEITLRSTSTHEELPDHDLNDSERLKLLQCYNPSIYGRLQPLSQAPPTQARSTKYLEFLVTGMEKIGERRPKSAASKSKQIRGIVIRPTTAPPKPQLRLGKVASQ